MASIQYGAMITAIRGSIGGWTFQSNRSGHIVRLRPQGKKTPSPLQAESISTNTQLVSAYAMLTPIQKSDWDDFALANTHEDRFGNTKTLNGLNWYISINRNRLIFGLGILNSPPIYALPAGNSLFTMDIDDTKIEITKLAPTNPADTGFKIFTTAPLARSTSSLQSQLRLTKVIPVGPFTTLDITTDWVLTHGCIWPPHPTYNVFIIGIQVQIANTVTGISIAGNTQLGNMIDPPVGIGYMIVGSTFVVDGGTPTFLSQTKNGTVFANDATVGVVGWVNMGNVQFDDANKAGANIANAGNTITKYLKATGFGFTIPVTATITGVKFKVRKEMKDPAPACTIKDYSIKLVKGGTFQGFDRMTNGDWIQAPTYHEHGGQTDAWGLSLTPADVNAVNFGVGLSADRNTADVNPNIARIYYYELTVYYKP